MSYQPPSISIVSSKQSQEQQDNDNGRQKNIQYSFNEEEYKLHARKLNSHYKNNKQKQLLKLTFLIDKNIKQNAQNNSSNTQFKTIKKRSSTTLKRRAQSLLFNHEPIELQEQRIATRKLQKQLQKFMPRNCSYSQFNREHKIIFQRLAKIQQTKQLGFFNQRIAKKKQNIQDDQQTKKKQILKKQFLLKQILRNKPLQRFRHKKQSKLLSKNDLLKNKPSIQQSQQKHLEVDSLPSPSNIDQQRFLFFPPSQTDQSLISKISQEFKLISTIQTQQTPNKKNQNSLFPSLIKSSNSKNKGVFNRSKSQVQQRLSHRSKEQESQSQFSHQKSYFISTLSTIQNYSQTETEASKFILNSSKNNQQSFHKKYDNLSDQTSQVIYGFCPLQLQEQTSSIYREELREMWMKNDMSKRK